MSFEKKVKENVDKCNEEERQKWIDELRNAAKTMGRAGGLKGGKARAEALTPERRSEIARKAGLNSWKNKKEK